MKKISVVPLIQIATALLLLLSANRTFAANFLSDDFNGSSVDVNKWTANLDIPGSSVTQGSGYVQLVNGGTLITKEAFTTPVTIRARFQLSAVESSNLKFVLRTDGDKFWSERKGIAVQLQCRTDWDGYVGQLAIFEIGTQTPETINFTTPLNLDQWYTVVIVDKGQSIDLYFDGATTPSLTLASSFSAGQNVAIYNREGGAAGSWISEGGTTRLDNVEIVPTDSDSDGVNDYREGKDGTNPNDASSFNPLSKGLVAYYPLDGNANDESGCGRHGTVYGGTFEEGRRCTEGLAFNTLLTTSNKITTPVNINQSAKWTFSSWFRTTIGGTVVGNDLNDQNLVLAVHTLGSGGEGKGQLKFGIFAEGLGVQIQTADRYDDGQWHHVTGVFDGTVGNPISSQFSVYVDGSQVTNLISGGNTGNESISVPLPSGEITIGFNRKEVSGIYNISSSIILQDVRIYDRALSEGEAKRIYFQEALTYTQKQFVYSNPELLGHYSLAQYNDNRTNGQTDVTTNPFAFNLFTKAQFDANRTNGQTDVTANPSSFGLYTADQYNANRTNGVLSALGTMPSVELSVPSSALLRAGLGTTNIAAVTASTLPSGWQFDSSTQEIYGRLQGTNPASALLLGVRPTGETIPIALNFTPVASEIASISIPISSKIQAGKTIKLPITIWNNATSTKDVTVEFSSSDEGKLAAPNTINNIAVPGKNSSSGKPGRATIVANLTAGNSAGEVELIASVGGVNSAPCMVTIKPPKRR